VLCVIDCNYYTKLRKNTRDKLYIGIKTIAANNAIKTKAYKKIGLGLTILSSLKLTIVPSSDLAREWRRGDAPNHSGWLDISSTHHSHAIYLTLKTTDYKLQYVCQNNQFVLSMQSNM